jgi:uncharacterized protein (UPF0248 family)
MKIMVKKGVVEEVFSKARFSEESNLYIVSYRDFQKIREIKLLEFIKESDNFQKIPISRITKIRKNNTVLFEKISKQDE